MTAAGPRLTVRSAVRLAGGLATPLLAAAACGPAPDDSTTIRLFAAASLAPALEQTVAEFEAAHGFRVQLNTASSSVLAKQIRAGAPADYFLSADRQWTDWLEAEGAAEPAVELWGNTLVVAVPDGAGRAASEPDGSAAIAASALRFDPEHPAAFADALTGRLALGDPDHVPLGRYTREALEHAGIWDRFAGRYVAAADARAALVLVERGDCAAGILYATDAAASPAVRTLGRIPAGWHQPIRYHGTVPAGSPGEKGCTLGRWFASPEVAERMRALGFAS
ncbi:MAG: molybdate ABC transporter substrate-binding protein [Gemmatimonadetes bacterium]|nr:molybdate ABC transporter substrate-binding protein [Gemmatimonadota bacterium]